MLDFLEEGAFFVKRQMNPTNCPGFNVQTLKHGMISPADNVLEMMFVCGLYSANSCM